MHVKTSAPSVLRDESSKKRIELNIQPCEKRERELSYSRESRRANSNCSVHPRVHKLHDDSSPDKTKKKLQGDSRTGDAKRKARNFYVLDISNRHFSRTLVPCLYTLCPCYVKPESFGGILEDPKFALVACGSVKNPKKNNNKIKIRKDSFLHLKIKKKTIGKDWPDMIFFLGLLRAFP